MVRGWVRMGEQGDVGFSFGQVEFLVPVGLLLSGGW